MNNELEKTSTVVMLGEVQTTLGLSRRELAQMFGVSRSTVSRWRRDVKPSEKHFQTLVTSYQETQLLKAILNSERLLDVIRRPAEIFEGSRALDLILKGGLERVRVAYDETTRYMG